MTARKAATSTGAQHAVNPASDMDKFNKQLAYSSGIRKVNLLSRRALSLVDSHLTEALACGGEAVDLGRRLLERLTNDDRRTNRYRKTLAAALSALGVCRLRSNELERAEDLLLEAFGIFKAIEEWDEMLSASYSLADVYYFQGNNAQALRQVEYGLDVCAQLKRRKLTGMLYAQKGKVLMSLGRHGEAGRALQNAVDRLGEYGPDDKAHILSTACSVYFHIGNLDAARVCIAQAIEVIKALEERRYNQVVFRQNHATVLLAMGRRAEAIAELKEAIRLARLGEYKFAEAWALKLLGACYMENGELYRAIGVFANNLSILREANLPERATLVQARLGLLYELIGDTASSRRHLAEAAETCLSTPDSGDRINTIGIIARLAPDLGELERYEQSLRETFEQTEAVGGPLPLSASIVQGVLLGLLNKQSESVNKLLYVVETGTRQGEPDLVARALTHLGLAAARAGDRTAALAHLNRAAEFNDKSPSWILERQIVAALTDLYEQLGNYREALEQHRRLRRLEKKVYLRQAERGAERLIFATSVEDLEQQCVELETRLRETGEEQERAREAARLPAARRDVIDATLKRVAALLNNTSTAVGHGEAPDIAAALELIDGALDGAADALESDGLEPEDRRFMQVLHERFPTLSATERKVCAYIRRSMSNKQIAAALNVSARAVETYRYRVRRKLALEAGADLNAFVLQLV